VNSPLPADLNRHPGVAALLNRLGLGEFEPTDLRSFLGRHDNWAGITTSGDAVFVKHFGDSGESRLRRVLAYEEQPHESPLSSPRCLGWDADTHLIAYEFLTDVEPGGELAREDEFTDALAAQAGEMVAALHRLPHAPADGRPRYPSLEFLHGLPAELFDRCSAAELEAWALMQSDQELVAALNSLAKQHAPQLPAHCDLRLDQFLLAGDTLYLTDWDEFRLADPARDVGGFAGEWLYRAVVGIWMARDSTVSVDPALTHEDILRIGVAELERLRPRISAFWSAYKAYNKSAKPDDELAARATAYAGWHMFDRMLAVSAQRMRLSGIDRAAAGIGRRALLAPAEFAPVLGLS
jgi:hypothetical protein